MPSGWPTVVRQRHVETVAGQLRSRNRHTGVVLVGGPGVGKTTLARSAVQAARARARWVAGTETARGIPLGALTHLVDVAGAAEPHTVLRAARAQLLGGGGDVLIGVDDAHMLDELSATLVHQLAIEHAASFVVTVRTGQQIPDAISALWKDDLLARIDLSPFTRGETAAVVESALGGPVETVSIDRIFETSGGNPLFLRHLVEGARQAGHLREKAGVWQLRGETVITGELSALVSARLEQLPEPVMRVMETLAFGGSLDLDLVVALRGRGAVEAAERAGMVQIGGPSNRLSVTASHPIYGEVVRSATGVLDARRIRSELVQELSHRPTDHVSDRIRIVDLAIGSDDPPSIEALTASASDALTLGDVGVAERFARHAWLDGGGLPAQLLLAVAAAWQGKAAEAETVLAQADPAAMNEIELLILATVRASNLFWGLADSSRASDVLDNARTRLTFPATVDLVEMLQAQFGGRLADSLRSARAVLDSGWSMPVARGWASFTAASALGQMGRLDEVSGLVEEGLIAATQGASGLLRFNLGLAEVPLYITLGPCDAAEHAARRYLDFAVGQQPARAKAGVLLGLVLLQRGRLRAAQIEFTQAIAALRGVGYVWEFLASSFLCMTCAALGDVPAAEEAIERVERLVGGIRVLFSAELEQARGWLAAARGETTAAIAHMHVAAEAAGVASRFAVQADALFTAARFGDRTVAERLAELATAIDGETVQVQAAHAAGVAEQDGAALAAVAARWEGLGALLFAADAAAQAAAAYERVHERRDKTKVSGLAFRLAEQCDDARTPALRAEAHPLPLTGREREIASMVAQGLSNKKIAERLVVSVRTVEGHIYRACTKLDVPDRDGLAKAVQSAG
ncbi:LuxR C-terminal-related transcriptional regulator [Aldersonia sp. NBC_00410]|uniref:helix-turn-helix transcriptional regulator n=1 Tax=Aldersonia sp. NBC_00410 TaxID=2975954 RepID=UPI00224F077A|nr:LuxR family transcriptional regulator [Aldersonia sp. NBC_00410]MCX5041981.1 LuxR C-terminal-related transcriptional regulator [Aldersonia sp. NBC_00410]